MSGWGDVYKDRQILYLISDSGGGNFPDNTSSSFTNVLGEAIVNHDQTPIYLRLLEAFLPNTLASDDFSEVEDERTRHVTRDRSTPLPGNVLNVDLAEIEAQAEGRKLQHSAGRLPYPRKITDLINTPADLVHCVPRHRPLLKLSNEYVYRLHVKITDIHHREVPFKPGLPTILVFEMQRHTNDSNFTMVCASLQPASHPDNTLNKFICPLPGEMELTNYEVALQQIMYPDTIKNRVITLPIKINDYKYDLEIDYHTSLDHIVFGIKYAIASSGLNNELIFDWDFRTKRAYFFRYESPKDGSAPVAQCLLQLPEEFKKATQDYAGGEGDLKISIAQGQRVWLERMPDIWKIIPSPYGMLNCSIIEDNVIGSRTSKTLQCVPFSLKRDVFDADGGLGAYEPEHLTYHKVTDKPFNAIEFSLTDANMEQKRFISERPETDMMMITLIFRRIRGGGHAYE